MKKVVVIFGGISTEHDVSVISAKSVIKNIDKEKYIVSGIYIDKDGCWYKVDFNKEYEFNIPESIIKLENITTYLKDFDVAFPVLHGLYGEDGKIQGMFEMLNIPYVGCNVLSSAIAMDKVYQKKLFKQTGIKQTKYVYLRYDNNKYIYVDDMFNETEMDIYKITDNIIHLLKFPMFVKPSNSGSSVGISKVKNKEELIKAIYSASKYDRKILIEEEIDGRELECGVLEDKDVITSSIGEVISAGKFYDYDSKYNNKESKCIIPADISKKVEIEIKNIAKKAFRIIDGKDISRIDFFLDKENNIYLNEINTMPGFTNISMYPKLFENTGLSYSKLLGILIENAVK